MESTLSERGRERRDRDIHVGERCGSAVPLGMSGSRNRESSLFGVLRDVSAMVQRLLGLGRERMEGDVVVRSAKAVAWGMFSVFSGCLLYTGEINHRPVVMIIAPENISRGEVAVYRAERSDPDQDGRTLALEWAAAGVPCPADGTVFPNDADVHEGTTEFQVPGTVTNNDRFCVWARVTDAQGASHVAMQPATTVAAQNRPPVAMLLLVSSPSGAPPYPLYSRFRVSAAQSSDPDGAAGDLQFDFGLQGPATSRAMLEKCDDAAASTQLTDRCFTADEPGSYRVTVMLTDKGGLTGSAELTPSVAVKEDQPPCIVSTDPPYGLNVVVRDPTTEQRFDVKVVSDDGDPFPPMSGTGTTHFAWFHGPEEGPLAALDWDLPSLTLPAGVYPSGSRVVIRLEVRDRKTFLASDAFLSCEEKALRCAVPAMSSCYQRVSWTVDYR